MTLPPRFRPVALCALYGVMSVIFCWPLFERPQGLGANDWDQHLFYYGGVLKNIVEYGQPILHVIGGRPSRELKAGVIDHMAFTADGLAATIAKLEARGLPYDCRRLPDRGTWQLFFHDPNGARIEMDFAADETR